MAANLWGDRFLGYREPAWHGLGTVFTEPLSATEALERADADYEIITVPLEYPEWLREALEIQHKSTATKQFALVRQAKGSEPAAVFGTVGDRYTPMQNRDIATALNPLTAEWPVETVGLLAEGKTLFLSLDAGEGAVRKNGKLDAIHQYFLVSNTHDKGRSLQIAFTPVRVVCQNTLMSGLSQAQLRANLPHLKGVKTDFEFRVTLMRQMREAQRQVMENMQLLADTAAARSDVKDILQAAYAPVPMPRKVEMLNQIEDTSKFSQSEIERLLRVREKWQYDNERVSAYRELAAGRVEVFNDEHPAFANTAWAAWQGITEAENYRRGKKGFESDVLFGERARIMARGFAACMNLATVGIATARSQPLAVTDLATGEMVSLS